MLLQRGRRTFAVTIASTHEAILALDLHFAITRR